MDLPFEIASGSVVGREHYEKRKNNQDGLCVLRADDAIIAVVTDGCGSAPGSEAGALLIAQWTAQAFLKRYIESAGSVREIMPRVREDVLATLKSCIAAAPYEAYPGSFAGEFLLASIVGAVVTPEEAVVFSLGDGVFAVNGEVAEVEPLPGNCPPYIAYDLFGASVKDQIPPDRLQFVVHAAIPADELQSLMIGTDGVCHLRAAESARVPGKEENVGPLSQFWSDDKYFTNPDQLRRRLSVLSRDATQIDWIQSCVTREKGVLPDDTTMVVIRRKERGA